MIFEFRVNGLDEIIRWILSYGDTVEVESPKLLRKKIARTAANISNIYNNRACAE